MLELSHNTIIISLCYAFWITNCALDESFKATFEQLIHLIVIIIIMPYAKHTLNIIPNGAPEARCIDLTVCTHRIICEVVGRLKFIVEKIANVMVQSIYEGITVIIPRVILHTKRRPVIQLSLLLKRREKKNKNIK